MTTTKIEGTLMLDGLIEGPMPPFPDMQAKLEKWSDAWPLLRFQLRVDGGQFSALPSNEPIAVKSLGDDASVVIADALSDLLRLFPPLERQRVFSTLRSVEWKHKLETRTIYAVGPEGRPATRQERAPCETIAPATPLSPKEMLIRGGLGILVAGGILGLSTFVIDYPKIWRHLSATTETTHVVAEAGPFVPYLQVELRGLDQQTGMLQLHVTRLAAYPVSDKELDALYEHPPEILVDPPTTAPTTNAATAPATSTAPAATPVSLLRRRLAIEALARGFVRVEFQDGAGRSLGQGTMSLSNLRDHAEMDVQVPAPSADNRIFMPARLQLLP